MRSKELGNFHPQHYGRVMTPAFHGEGERQEERNIIPMKATLSYGVLLALARRAACSYVLHMHIQCRHMKEVSGDDRAYSMRTSTSTH